MGAKAEKFNKWTTSLTWSYFWIIWAVVFMVINAISGNFLLMALMVAFAVFESLLLSSKLRGTNIQYNKYHGKAKS